MDKRNVLMGTLLAMSLYMTYVVVTTSMQHNLFKEWSMLAGIPWMSATLKDFYQNLFIIWLWVLYKENALWKAILWGIAFVTMGSIVTPLYVFLQLRKLKPGDNLGMALQRV